MTNDLTRTVFGTSTEADPEHPKVFGAVEVGLQFEDGKITKIQVLYRALDGAIFDITSSVEFDYPPSGNPTTELTLKRKLAPDVPAIGFTIAVFSLTQVDEASFAGILEHNNISVPWKGRFVAFRNSSLAVIQAGLSSIDKTVQSFLDISPLLDFEGRNEAEDRVQTWAATMYGEMLQNATSQRAKGLFNLNPEEVGGVFSEKYYDGYDLPDILTKNVTDCKHLSLQDTYDSNVAMFQMASWHHLCHWLKSVQWLEREFRDAIKDKIGDFYQMLRCPEAELEKWKNQYGSGFPAAQNAIELRRQYSDAINRCYFAAYYCFKEDSWDEFLEAPRAFFKRVRDVLLSDSWLEHWLPRLVNLKDNKGELSIQRRLGLLRDKLNMLEIVGKFRSPNDEPANVDAVIEKLAQAAGETGIVALATMVKPDSKAVPLDAHETFNEQEKREIALLSVIQEMDGGFSYTAEDVESRVTHWFLNDDATPLGLYDWHFHFSLFG